ncbi:MAG: tetratricopeptide repeat protein [Planctomycetes bacterium]|nr:tetratricopeptide repeat protein [Planctomycetota bacterium]
MTSTRILSLALIGVLGVSQAAFARDESAVPIGRLELEDPLEIFIPNQPRSEADEDRIVSSAMFTRARLQFNRREFSKALRNYQRAWRYDPEAVLILREIVPLAFNLKRNDEAARYAILAAEKDPRDPILLRRLAIHLTQQQDFGRAVHLYEKSLNLQKDRDRTTYLLRMEMGRLYFLTGEFAKCATSFAKVRDALADPEKYGLDESLQKSLIAQAEQTYALMAEGFLQAKRYMEAIEMFEKANDAKPNKGKLAMQLARVAEKQKQTEAALKQLDVYFAEKLSSAGSEPYELLHALLKEKLQDDKKALDAVCERLSKLREEDPANTPLGYSLADRLREKGDLATAVKIYQESLKTKPALDGYTGLVEIYRSQNNVEGLLDTLGEAVLKVGTLQRLGDTAKQVTENKELVGKLIDAARQRMNDENRELGNGVALAIGMLAIEAKRFDDSEPFFEEALKSDEPPKRQLMFTWGLGLMMADEFERAARLFRRGIEEKVVDDDDPDFHFYLAGALELNDKTDEALAAAKEAAAKKPDDPRYQSRASWILYHAKRYEEAKKSYTAMLDKSRSNYKSTAVRDSVREAKLILSNICVHQERMNDAIEWLEEVLDEFPEHVGALNDLGYLWADEGVHLHRALQMTRKAVAGEPENVAYRDSLGWALYRLGRHKEAVKELETAAAGEAPDGVILDHLGDTYLKNDDAKKALATWKRAAEALKKQDEPKILKKVNAKIKKQSSE